MLLPVLHVNETKGGYFSVFDKVHFIDRQKQVVVSADVSPKGKNKCPKTKVVEHIHDPDISHFTEWNLINKLGRIVFFAIQFVAESKPIDSAS